MDGLPLQTGTGVWRRVTNRNAARLSTPFLPAGLQRRPDRTKIESEAGSGRRCDNAARRSGGTVTRRPSGTAGRELSWQVHGEMRP